MELAYLWSKLTAMFYKIVSLLLVLLGVAHFFEGVTLPLSVDENFLHYSGIGLATAFLGILNFVYVYESPSSAVPKIILLSANILFIGFSILLISAGINVIYAWLAVILSIINCIMVLNHRV